MMLKGKTCLITGGGTGIGRATARRFAEEGAHIWIVGRNEQNLRDTADAIGSACTTCPGDVTQADDLQAIVNDMPLLRPGEPDEIAEAVLFFANPRNTYCTGSVLTVDGGLTITF